MRHIESKVKTSDGLNLYAQAWLPDGEPKAMLAFSHGQSEHIGRYAHVGAALAAAGYGLHMADLRGHGKSPGARGHIMGWQDYLNDFAAIREGARQAAPAAKQFLGGHSLGGLIALSAAVQNPPGYEGVIASAPLLRLAFEAPAWKAAMGRVLSGIVPGLTMSNELDASGLSHDRAIVEAYVSDPMVHGKVTARFFTEMLRAQVDTLQHARDLRLPLLVMHGAADPIVSPQASREFYEAAGSADKTLKLYDGLYHEIFNEPEKEQVLADLIAWLDAHL
jgi:alpha-beta hydrolase superfamily lysophospholipase